MVTIARQFADYGLSINYKDLPEEVVHQAKRVMLDTLGCATGGYPSPAANIIRGVIGELSGAPESTIIGTGAKTSCLNATLANGAMVRFLDYNDTYALGGPVMSGSHPSEVIPPILAVGERQHSTGKQVIEAIVAGYELSARYTSACQVKESLEVKGWNCDLRGGFVVPVAVGRLLGLTAEQMENAIGTAASLNMVLGILDASKEEYTMTKNLRFPLTAYDSIIAAFLARKGFTGPRRIFEGQRGYIEAVMHGDFDVAKCTDFTGFRIMDTRFKPFTADATTHGHLSATVKLAKEHDIKPEDVAKVTIWATSRDVEHTGQPEKRYPRNKETADHSSFYLTAIAITDRAVGPKAFSPERFADPKLRELNDKVSFEADSSLDKFFNAGISEITTKQGQTYKTKVEYPRGDPNNPMPDKELEDKFRGMASVYMNEAQMKALIKAVYELDKMKDIGELMKLAVFKK